MSRSDDTTPTGSPVSRSRSATGTWVPLSAIGVVVLAYGIWLFQRSETMRADYSAQLDAIRATMETGRASRNAQVSAVERDVVRLQDQQANTAAVMTEIKSDMREILTKLDRIERKAP